MSWNYRVATRINKKPEDRPPFEDWREFMIISCYYNENGKPDGYSDKTHLGGFEFYSDLMGAHELMTHAFKSPILDLDNWPEEYKPEPL